MSVTIYHNPRCNTSRRTLALLREKGVEPDIVEYLKTPYTAAQLKQLLSQLKMPASALVRKKEATAAGIAGWELDALDALVSYADGIQVDTDEDGSGFYINGQHKTRAMLDQGVRRTIVIRWQDPEP